MARLRLLIIEDNADEAAYLQSILQQLQYDVTGIATNLQSATAMAEEQHPDLCIVDIFLGGKPDGIAFAKTISNIKADIPFLFLTSNYDNTTFQLARSVNPHSYLLKPYNPLELQYAIELAIDKMNQTYTRASARSNNLFVKTGNTISRINIHDIIYIEVEGKYSKMICGEEKYLVQQSLKDLEELLPADHFLRIHRNFVVNVRQVEKVNLQTNEVKLKNGVTIAFSKHYMNDLAARFVILK